MDIQCSFKRNFKSSTPNHITTMMSRSPMEVQGVEFMSPEQQQQYKPSTPSNLASHVLHHFTDIDGSGDLYKGEFVVVTRFDGR